MLYFILNPKAQSKGSGEVWPEISRVLHQQAIPHQVLATRYEGHAGELARAVSEKDPLATVVAVGGDGSIHEIISGLTNLSTVTLGVIPCGSANDFARGMGIPSEIGRALRTLLDRAHVVRIDLGIAEKDGRKSRFAVSCGIGFDAAVCHEALASRMKDSLNGLGLGRLTYSAIAAKQIALYEPETVTIETDGGRSFRFDDVYFVAAMNQRCEGGGLMLTPKARPDDGVLDLFVCGGLTRAGLIGSIPATRTGSHTHIPGPRYLRCRTAVIRTGKPRPIHLDGESGGIGNALSVSLLPERLQVITA